MRAAMLGELNCKYPGAARAPLDKNALSGIEPSSKAPTAIGSPMPTTPIRLACSSR
jgi:hypothetical protein